MQGPDRSGVDSVADSAAEQPSGRLKTSGVYYGWWMVLAAALNQAYSAGIAVYSQGIFFKPITAGNSAGGLIIPPIVGLFIARSGWRNTAVILGLLRWAIGFPLASKIRSEPPEYYGLLPDGDTSEGETHNVGATPRSASEARP